MVYNMNMDSLTEKNILRSLKTALKESASIEVLEDYGQIPVSRFYKADGYFLAANTNSERCQEQWASFPTKPKVNGFKLFSDCKQSLANTNQKSEQGLPFRKESEYFGFGTCGKRLFRDEWWKTEPNVGRVVDGVSLRVDRLKRLGNAVVPLQAKTAFEILMGIK